MPIYPGASNTFVRNFEASGKLKIEFSRNPKSFALPNYAAMRKVTKTAGYWLKLGNSEASRIVSQNKHRWAPSANFPDANDVNESFSYKLFDTERFGFGFNFGTRTVENADWDLVPWMARTVAQKAMTNRTLDALTEMTTAGNWGGLTDTATNLGGGKWDVATFALPYIRKTFNAVMQSISKQTQGAVAAGSSYCLVSPVVAAQMAESEEIRDYVKQQESAVALQKMEDRPMVMRYGLPEMLYGVRMIVDDTVRVTTEAGASTTTRGYVLGATTAIFGTNTVDVLKSELPPGENVPFFDTLTLFLYEDMTVEQMEDPVNRRTMGRVVDDFDAILTCPESGYLVTAVVD